MPPVSETASSAATVNKPFNPEGLPLMPEQKTMTVEQLLALIKLLPDISHLTQKKIPPTPLLDKMASSESKDIPTTTDAPVTASEKTHKTKSEVKWAPRMPLVSKTASTDFSATTDEPATASATAPVAAPAAAPTSAATVKPKAVKKMDSEVKPTLAVKCPQGHGLYLLPWESYKYGIPWPVMDVMMLKDASVVSWILVYMLESHSFGAMQ
jgi:hypothetical protein